MSNEVFEDRLGQVLEHFNKVNGTSINYKIKVRHEKGINIHVLATVTAMLMAWSNEDETKFGINILHDKDMDLSKSMKRLDYRKFDPYVTYIMTYGKKGQKVEKARMRAEYIAMFVRYIYLLKEIGEISD